MTPQPESTPPPPPMQGEAESAPSMNQFQRLFGVLFSPGETFADIARKPRWLVPVLLVSLVSGVFIHLFSQRVGWETMFRQQMDQNPQAYAQMTAAEREQTLRIQTAVAPYISYATPVLTGVVNFITAVILLFLFDTILGADIGLRRFMAVVSYGGFANMVGALLAIAVLFMKPPEDFDLNNPLAFNLAAYLPADSPGWLKGFGGAMDLFSFWTIGLYAIGISAASRKVSVGKAVGVILFPWGLWVCLRTALGALQG